MRPTIILIYGRGSSTAHGCSSSFQPQASSFQKPNRNTTELKIQRKHHKRKDKTFSNRNKKPTFPILVQSADAEIIRFPSGRLAFQAGAFSSAAFDSPATAFGLATSH